jgi:drug/metabolite transporter (DMT)-like permease
VAQDEKQTLKPRLWLLLTFLTTLFWGVWGACVEIPEKAGFPATLGYTVWSVTMIPCALYALHRAGWRLECDLRSALLGSAVGFLGAGGTLLLFVALRTGPAYLVFPVVSLYPMLTVILAAALLRERAGIRAWTGIVLAAPAMVLLAWQSPNGAAAAHGPVWLLLALLVFLSWGVQAYLMKLSNGTMRAESIFFYMAATGVLLAPVAMAMTDFGRPITWGFRGPYLAGMIHLLNAVGALSLVYAFRYGKAIIVAPITALAPMLTVLLSLIFYGVIPGPILTAGMVLATTAIVLMAE